MPARAPDRVHEVVQAVLRAGLAIAVAAMAAGLVVCLATGRDEARRVVPSDLLKTQTDLGTRLLLGGILVLAATPAARVVVLGVAWARARDWRFAVVALVVAIVLGAAAWLGYG